MLCLFVSCSGGRNSRTIVVICFVRYYNDVPLVHLMYLMISYHPIIMDINNNNIKMDKDNNNNNNNNLI